MSVKTLPTRAAVRQRDAEPAPPSAAASALDLQAALLSHPQLAAAGAAWVRALALHGGFERVSLGLNQRHGIDVIAMSTASATPLADGSAAAAALSAALGEAIDQSASIAYPALGTQPRITLAHSRLLGANAGAGSGGAASVPLVCAGKVIGALCVERASRRITAAELQRLEHLACLAAPVLNLMRLNQRPLRERLQDAVRSAWATLGQARARGLAAAGAALLAVLAWWPLDWHIGGHARLEGAVQRLLVAPADGFLSQVHARPGETVRAGQLLVELADQDLLVEQQRWQSQLAQYESAYATANARADRAQQVIQQARAAEAQAQLALVQMKLARGRIEAPFDGLVVQGDLSQQLGAPLRQGAELMTIAPQGQFRVIVEVDERDIAVIAIGQTGSLALSALPWHTLPIRVTRITPVASAVEGRNVFEVEAELIEQASELRPGLQGSAHILAGQRSAFFLATRRVIDGARLALWSWWG